MFDGQEAYSTVCLGVNCNRANLRGVGCLLSRSLDPLFTEAGGGSCYGVSELPTIAFEIMSKRRRGYPSETHVKRGQRSVGQGKELLEKLGRNDLCPCLSGKLFRKCCLSTGRFRWG